MSKVIELTPEMAIPTSWGWKTKSVLLIFKLVLIISFLVIAAHYVVIWSGQVKDWGITQYGKAIQSITKVEVIREYIKPEAVPVEQLIPIVSKDMRVPKVALQALVLQESNGKALYRFEPRVYERLKNKIKDSDSEIRMLSSSHGVAHVMGFNAKERCGIHWSKLYDPITGLECGARILRENLDRYKTVKEPSEKLWFALRDYNGAGEEAENYANVVMAKVGKLLYAGLKEEL